MSSIKTLRRFYARYVTATGGVFDERIVDAYSQIKREAFVGRGPWHICTSGSYITSETSDPSILYQDILVGLSPDRGINNGEPSLHARCLAAANPRLGEVVVHVGAGTGYYTAILSRLVGKEGHVHAFEIELDIAARAYENLGAYKNVTVRAESAISSAIPTADLIYVSAGATHVPSVWLDSLAIGGRLVLPLTPNERHGCMLLVKRRSAAAYAARVFYTVSFIACVGARDDVQSAAIAAALDAGGTEKIRSLRRNGRPDASAWCVGTDWWLSTEEHRE